MPSWSAFPGRAWHGPGARLLVLFESVPSQIALVMNILNPPNLIPFPQATIVHQPEHHSEAVVDRGLLKNPLLHFLRQQQTL